MSLEQAIQENTLAMKELAAAIKSATGPSLPRPAVRDGVKTSEVPTEAAVTKPDPVAETAAEVADSPVEQPVSKKPMTAREMKELVKPRGKLHPEVEEYIMTHKPLKIRPVIDGGFDDDRLPKGERDVEYYRVNINPTAVKLMKLTNVEKVKEIVRLYPIPPSESNPHLVIPEKGSETPSFMWGHLLQAFEEAIEEAEAAAKSAASI